MSGLPAPTGSHRVGRRSFHWVDAQRHEPNGDPRELIVWLWYPANPDAAVAVAEYLPPGWDTAAQFWGFRTEGVSSHAYAEAPVASERARFPVLLFSPSGFPPLLLSALLEEVASHGYIVAGINHTYESAVSVFPDGRVVPMDSVRMQPVLGPFDGIPEQTHQKRARVAERQAADIQFVAAQLETLNRSADPLAGRIDLERLAAFGHSLGGNAALEFAQGNERSRAVANLDGGIWSAIGQTGLARPTMQILADHAEMAMPCPDIVKMGAYPSVEWCEAERALTIGGWQTVFELGAPGYGLLVRGSGHISFMDLPFLPAVPGSMIEAGLALVRIDAARAWRVICDSLLAFFDRHVRDADAPLLHGPSAEMPELLFGPPRDLIAALGPRAT